MTEEDFKQELNRQPFQPIRLHLVSGKTIDITRENTGWPLSNRLLVFRNPAPTGVGADGYDVIAYEGVERVEVLDIGKRSPAKRKPA